MTTATRAPLIDADRLASAALRRGETRLKRQTFKVEDAAVRRLSRLYAAAFADLRARASTLADHYGLTTLASDRATAAWREAFLADVSGRVSALKTDVWTTALKAGAAALRGNYYGRLWLVDVGTKADVRIHAPLLRPADALHEDVYDDLIQSLLGKEWRQQFGLELDDLTLKIRRAIGQGVIDGDGIDGLMRRVAADMGVSTDRRRGALGSAERLGYRGNFNRVQTITRTVVNQLSNAGAVSAYQANADVLDGYEWLTASDERVCPQCAALDGTTYRLADTFRPPAHPNCRCTVIPVIRSEFQAPSSAGARVSLEMWARGFGMERELADFLVPQD